jgi:hypothetical protein
MGFTLFFLVYGVEAILPTDLEYGSSRCRMDFPGPTASVGTRTDYLVGPSDYSACATRHLMA